MDDFEKLHALYYGEELSGTLGASRYAAYSSANERSDANMLSNYPDVLTVDQLMDILHIGRNAAYGLLKSGDIKTLRVGRRYIIPKRNVAAYIISI